MSKEDIDLIWEKINCEACYNENINYCKEKCECKCKEFKALENILSQQEKVKEELEGNQKSYSIAYNQGKAFENHKWKSEIKKLLKTKFIEYDCEDCITGKFIEVEDVEELLKDGGE